MARKNAKSATIAVLALAHLVGPLRAPGWRMGILSINRSKAGELRQQIEDIACSSGFRCSLPGNKVTNPDLQFRATPWPGKVIGDDGSRVEIEGAGYGSERIRSRERVRPCGDRRAGTATGTAQGRGCRHAFVSVGEERPVSGDHDSR